MNRRILLVPILFLLVGLHARAETPVDLHFEVPGMPDGYCRIIGMVGGNNYLADSFPAKGGKAVYTSEKLLDAGLFYLVFPDQQTYFQFLLDKDQQFTMRSDLSDLTANMQVIGSEDNQLFYENLRYETKYRKQFDSVDQLIKANQLYKPDLAKQEALRDQLLKDRKSYIESLGKEHPNSFFTHFKLAGQNPDLQYPKKSDGTLDTIRQTILYRDAYWNNTNIADERLLRTPVIVNKLKTYITQLVSQRPDSVIKYMVPLIEKAKSNAECFKFVVNWLAIQYEKPTTMGGEKILVYLVDNYYTDAYAQPWFTENPYELVKIRLRADNMRPSLLGKTGQDLKAKNLAGIYENAYAMKAPVKIIMFYSPECEHCQKEAPEVAELLRKWKGKVDVFAFCVDKDENKWREFVAKYHTEAFHNVIDPQLESLYYKKYHIDITPEIYVLDPNHTIVAKDLHPNQLEPVFEEILEKAGIH
jgi:thiol-disulfide isomerase/thioredoxin